MRKNMIGFPPGVTTTLAASALIPLRFESPGSGKYLERRLGTQSFHVAGKLHRYLRTRWRSTHLQLPGSRQLLTPRSISLNPRSSLPARTLAVGRGAFPVPLLLATV